MKKKKLIMLFALFGSFISSTTAYASIEDVNTFLSQYAKGDNAFYTEEFSGEDISGTKSKSLIVRTDLAKINIEPNSTENIFSEMVSQDWFDYTTICNINVNSSIGSMASTYYYDIASGTKISSSSDCPLSMRSPWIIKTESDITVDERTFIMRIAQEILQGNLDTSISLHIGADNESRCQIKTCNGLAEVSGTYDLNGSNYNFATQFTYDTTDNQNGTYNELYLCANDIDIYGTNVKFEYRTFDK